MNEDKRPQGSVYVEMTVSGRIALSQITDHWTVDEAQAFLAGDPEAREELIRQASAFVLNKPDEVDTNITEIDVSSIVVNAGQEQR